MSCTSHRFDLLSHVILHSCHYSQKGKRCSSTCDTKSPGKESISSVSSKPTVKHWSWNPSWDN